MNIIIFVKHITKRWASMPQVDHASTEILLHQPGSDTVPSRPWVTGGAPGGRTVRSGPGASSGCGLALMLQPDVLVHQDHYCACLGVLGVSTGSSAFVTTRIGSIFCAMSSAHVEPHWPLVRSTLV